MDESYNGYTNYETWVVFLWIANEQSMQGYWEKQAAECLAGMEDSVDDATWRVADLMRDWYGEARAECHTPGMFGDLLNAALSKVHWMAIARNYITNEEKV